MVDIDINKWSEKRKQQNEALIIYFENSRIEWGNKITPLIDGLRTRKVETLLDVQALSLSYMHMAADEISNELVKLSKTLDALRKARSNRFLHYITKSAIKMSKGERDYLIDGELSELQCEIEIRQAHIDFIREIKDNCKHIQYSLKNRLEMAKYLE